MPLHRHIKRLAAAAALFAALGGGVLIASSSADLQSQIQANQSTAASLQDQINSETAQIEKTAGGVAAAKQRLSVVQAELDQHISALREVQTQLTDARNHLLALEARLRIASKDLASNLRAEYENGSPNLVDVILNAHGFSNLLNQISYLKDAQRQDAQIVDFTRIARAEVLKQTDNLATLESRQQALTNQVYTQRNDVAAIESALINQQMGQVARRSHARAKLASVTSETQALQRRYDAIQAAAAAERQSEVQVSQQAGSPVVASSSMVQPPPGAPEAVVRMMAAGNTIATLPYIWGGGHGSINSPGYDCSGSVSYVLIAAGLLSSPEVSGNFESYGDPGPGKWVTIYANAGHVWMTIAGWRFDTVALSEDGTRWSRGGGEYGGFVVRHPPGL